MARSSLWLLSLTVVLSAITHVVIAGDGSQVPGRGIGISEEERLEHAAELEAEEAKRLAVSKEDKEAKAKRDIERLNQKSRKVKKTDKKKPALTKKGEGRAWKKKEVDPDELKPVPDIYEARGIGITEEEGERYRKELAAEEAKRFAVSDAEKKKKAQADIDKLNAKTRRQATKGKKKMKKKAKKVKKVKKAKKTKKHDTDL